MRLARPARSRPGVSTAAATKPTPLTSDRDREPVEGRVGLARAVEVVAVEQDQRRPSRCRRRTGARRSRSARRPPAGVDRGAAARRRARGPRAGPPRARPGAPWSRSGPSRSRGMRSASEPATPYSTAAITSTPTSLSSVERAAEPIRAPVPTPRPIRNASVPGGRGERVGGDQVVGVHHVRQRRGQPGEQEAVDREAARISAEQQPARATSACTATASTSDQPDAHEVRPGQHLPARPAVEQHADERPEHAERQQHDGQRARRSRRVRAAARARTRRTTRARPGTRRR